MPLSISRSRGGLVSVTIETIPEPSSAMFCALLLTGLNARRRRSAGC